MSMSNNVRFAAGNRPKSFVLQVALTILVATMALRVPAQVEYVDPTIGNVGHPPCSRLVRRVFLPNSMVRVYPIRTDALDDQIKSFPLTISSHRMDELFSIMPGDGGSRPAYDQEKTTPYYYSSTFDESYSDGVFGHGTLRLFPYHFSVGQCFCGACQSSRGGSAACKATAQSLAKNASTAWRRMSTASSMHRSVLNSNPSTTKSRLIVSSADAKSLDFRYGISFISVGAGKEKSPAGNSRLGT